MSVEAGEVGAPYKLKSARFVFGMSFRKGAVAFCVGLVRTFMSPDRKMPVANANLTLV